MKYLLQLDFPYTGPFNKQMTEAMNDLAKDIAGESGLLFKLWTENKDTNEAGGIYVFDNEVDAKRYLEKHTKRLESFGITNIKSKQFEINEELSLLSKATFLEKL